MKALWGGRFTGRMDPAFKRFNDSFRFDKRLLGAEVAASRAYAAGLGRCGVLTAAEVAALERGLATVAREAEAEPQRLAAAEAAGCEDVHTYVESRLVELVGDPALKLHTGRSRNEQVATDFRLFVRDAIASVDGAIARLATLMIDRAEAEMDVLMPGYTHMQRAQPILWSHYLMSFVAMLQRDQDRLRSTAARLNVSPLGSGAIAGSAFGLDREAVAAELGFTGVTTNSLDATSDRDFVAEFIFDLTLVMMHLSRMSEDLILFATTEFGFVTHGDEVSTGSSLMPQKKNPDALELIRGKSGAVLGQLTGLLCTMKALPSGYNKDLQEDKEPAFAAFDTALACLEVMATVVATLTLDKTRLAGSARGGFLNATDLAELLVRRGVPFRTAHEITGKLVREAAARGVGLEDLGADVLGTYPELAGEDLRSALSLGRCVSARNSSGGTAPEQVRAAIAAARRALS
jgi:argininosuccinate lyase